MLSLEIASILPFHWGFSHELHEDPSVASKTVHEEVDGFVDVVRLLDEHDKFLLFETRPFHSIFECTSSVVICLEFVFSNLRLTVSENLLSLCRSKKSPNLFILRVVTLSFLGARNGSPH